MLDREIFDWSGDLALEAELKKYANNQRVIPFEIKRKILVKLNEYTKSDFTLGKIENPQQLLDNEIAQGLSKLQGLSPTCFSEICDRCKDWKPENCTIDMALVVRLSEQGTQEITAALGNGSTTIETNIEQNVRAVANVIQLKSGEGVVMAGLIG
jgi:hypothetical protein